MDVHDGREPACSHQSHRGTCTCASHRHTQHLTAEAQPTSDPWASDPSGQGSEATTQVQPGASLYFVSARTTKHLVSTEWIHVAPLCCDSGWSVCVCECVWGWGMCDTWWVLWTLTLRRLKEVHGGLSSAAILDSTPMSASVIGNPGGCCPYSTTILGSKPVHFTLARAAAILKGTSWPSAGRKKHPVPQRCRRDPPQLCFQKIRREYPHRWLPPPRGSRQGSGAGPPWGPHRSLPPSELTSTSAASAPPAAPTLAFSVSPRYPLPPPGSAASLGGRADPDFLSRSQMPHLFPLLSLCCCTRALSSCGEARAPL